MLPSLLPLFLLLPQSQAPTDLQPPVSSLVQLDLLQNGISVVDLQRLDFDVAAESGNLTTAQVVADADDLARLRNLDWSFQVLHTDLAAFYAERAAADRGQRAPAGLGDFLSPPFASGSMGGYYTLAETISVLDQITAAFPNLTSDRFSIGSSIEGRNIWAVKGSDNPDIDE